VERVSTRRLCTMTQLPEIEPTGARPVAQSTEAVVIAVRRSKSSCWCRSTPLRRLGAHVPECIRTPLWIATLALMSSACDPQTTLTGTITHADGKPIAHAIVQTICEDQSGAMKAVSDDAGRFSTEGLGCIADSCRLEVTAPENPLQTLRVRDYCTSSRFACRGECSALDVVLKVTPK
jgi:hypothetical protein